MLSVQVKSQGLATKLKITIRPVRQMEPDTVEYSRFKQTVKQSGVSNSSRSTLLHIRCGCFSCILHVCFICVFFVHTCVFIPGVSFLFLHGSAENF